MTVNRGKDGSADVLLHESPEGLHWQFSGILASCGHRYGNMWECPDFFHLDGKAELRQMLSFANAAAAIITTRKGALRVMPTESEIRSLMAQAESAQ